MTHDQIDQFESHSGDARANVDLILDAADHLRTITDATRLSLMNCNRAVAVLRRTDEPQMMGPLNSLSAAHQRHRSLSAALEALEAALSTFEDCARDLRILHPSVVKALREKVKA